MRSRISQTPGGALVAQSTQRSAPAATGIDRPGRVVYAPRDAPFDGRSDAAKPQSVQLPIFIGVRRLRASRTRCGVRSTGCDDMCLAVPMKITGIDGFNATCEAKGIQREVSLFMLQGEPIDIGDHVLIHVGYAIQKISEEEAQSTWDLFDEILEHA